MNLIKFKCKVQEHVRWLSIEETKVKCVIICHKSSKMKQSDYNAKY
jgi:hypothetical protein